MTEDETFARLKQRVVTDQDGYVIYYDEMGNYHRDNGPAVTRTDGYEAWYYHGTLHRKDGPAVRYSNGLEAFYDMGKFLYSIGKKEPTNINDGLHFHIDIIIIFSYNI